MIPYFIAAHPGTTDKDMLNLALWLKKNAYKADQVQAFLPSPMSTASAMYRSGRNPLKKISRIQGKYAEKVFIPRRKKQRDLHKAFLRYHDPDNWAMLRAALKDMGRSDLIGSSEHCLVPDGFQKGKRVRNPSNHHNKRQSSSFRTQHARQERKRR